MEMELLKIAGTYCVTKERQCGSTNFMSWERLDRELLAAQYPRDYITGITVSERGLEIRLGPLPIDGGSND